MREECGGGVGVETGVSDASDDDLELVPAASGKQWLATTGAGEEGTDGWTALLLGGVPLSPWVVPGVGECGAVRILKEGDDDRNEGDPRRVLKVVSFLITLVD